MNRFWKAGSAGALALSIVCCLILSSGRLAAQEPTAPASAEPGDPAAAAATTTAAEPKTPTGTEAAAGSTEAPKERTLADVDLGVSTEDAFELTRQLARQGIFVGISSGANLAGALRVAKNAADAVVVVVFCDGGEKYLSERLWDEEPALDSTFAPREQD